MSNLRAKLSQLATRKVPVLALVVVAMFGMVAGVLAANLTVNQTSNAGEIGTYHTSSGTMTIADNGLGVVPNSASASTTATFPASANNVNVNNILTAGHWFDSVIFTDTLTDNTAHTATITLRDGAGINGILLATATFTLTGPNAASSGTVTAYVDTSQTSLTSPITVYVTVT